MAYKSNMLFDVLENILKTKSEKLYIQHISSPDMKDAAPYMVRRYLTMHANREVRQTVLDNYLQLERMPEKIQYLWLLRNIPRVDQTFIRYLR